METELFLCLALLLGACSAALQPISSCQDLDSSGCQVFFDANPNLCQDPMFAQSVCKRFCGNCPLECYDCRHPVTDPDDCNTTTICGNTSSCMIKHLHARDGHHEYIMTCEERNNCGGLPFGFGKRDISDVEELDARERALYQRELTLDCCDSDFCNTIASAVTTTTTTLPPPTTTVAAACKKDVVFAVDESGSVGNTNFRHMMDGFVGQVASSLDIGPDNAQVAMVGYSSTPMIMWYLNQHNDKQSLVSAIHRVPYHSGGTRTDLALDVIMSNVLTATHGDRPDADNVVVVITDGKSNKPIMTAAEATKLHNYSHDIISIGVGPGPDKGELNAIATDNHHVFASSSFQDLQSLVSSVVNIICQ